MQKMDSLTSEQQRIILENLIKQGKNDEFKSILTQANDPSSYTDNFGNTLLHTAAKYNNIEIIQFLLSSNLNINSRNSSGSTPLIIAAEHNNFDAVKFLLNSNDDIFAINAANETVLRILWSQKENVPIAVFECLLEAMKRSEADPEMLAQLFIHAECELEFVLVLHNASVTQEVLERMITIDIYQSRSALNFAMKTLDFENVRVLLHYGPHKEARIALFFGNLLGADVTILEKFMSVLSDWDIVNQEKLDYFHDLFLNGSEDVVSVLLRCEIDVWVKSKFGIDLIPAMFGNRNIDIVELMKNRKFNVNAQGFRQLSALHFAVKSQKQENVQFLIDLGANLEIRDDTDRTPLLDNHAWNGECVGKILLQHGADVQAVNYVGNPIWNVMNVDRIHEFIIPHIAMLVAKNIEIDRKLQSLISSYEFLENYGYCCQQLDELRAFRLTESFTLLDVLTERTERVADQLGDQDFTVTVTRYCLENQITPYYCSTLEMKLRRARVVFRSRCNLAMIVSEFTGCVVGYDHLVIEKICDFLTYRDACALLRD